MRKNEVVACVATAMAVALVLATSPAFAADGNVTIPYGDYIGQAVNILLGIAGVIVAFAFRAFAKLVGPNVANLLKVAQAEQMLAKAVDYGLNAVAGATKGQKLELNVANAVVAQGVQYVIDAAPGAVVEWLGGVEGIRAKIIARLDVSVDAAVRA